MKGYLRRFALLGALIAVPLSAGFRLTHPAQAQAVAVTIENFAFQQATLTVPAGTTVTWTNQDTAPHTVTSDNGSFGSGTLNAGQSFSFTFSQPGTFTYHCAFHSFMTGSVIVQSAAGNSPTATTSSTASGTAESEASPTPTVVPPTTVPTLTPPPATSGAGKKIVRAAVAQGRFVFSPKVITIKMGTKVTWENPSDVPHTVTSLSTGWKFKKPLNGRKSVSFVFKKAGTYNYHCIFHPGMNGRIVVKRK